MTIVFTGIVQAKVRSATRRLVKNAGKFGIAVRAGPEQRADLPPGHPPLLGIEHVDPVIMTVLLHCSMAEVVELLKYDMPKDMAVVPIPSERLNIR